MAFFWPRNTILFIEGPAVHSVDVLRQTADEFQRMHWWRVAFNAFGSAAVFTGFLRLYRYTLTIRPRHIDLAGCDGLDFAGHRDDDGRGHSSSTGLAFSARHQTFLAFNRPIGSSVRRGQARGA